MTARDQTGNTFKGRHRTYTIGKYISHGGEGSVYEVTGHSQLVAKIYNPVKFNSANSGNDGRKLLQEKIETMLDNPVQTYDGSSLMIAWPKDILIDSSGQFCGYIMPRVYSERSLISAYDIGTRKKAFPQFTWKSCVTIAYNLAAAVSLVHGSGYVIGDMNEKNFLVSDRGHITVIDTDSFNVHNKNTGRTYKCTVGLNELMPPELQGRNRSLPDTRFTTESDNFGLAIQIFRLLMNGVHPFDSVSVSRARSVSSYSGGNEIYNITNGICPYVTGGRGKPGKFAPDMKILPAEIRKLFDRVFGYNSVNAARKSVIAARPSASEWMNALKNLLNQKMTVCSHDSSHVYPACYGKCPWCQISKNTGFLPSIRTSVTGSTNAGGNLSLPVGQNIQRDSELLYILCIAGGVLFSPFFASHLVPLIASVTTWWIPWQYIAVMLSLMGASMGYGIAYCFEKQYVSSSNYIPWLLLALLPPLLAPVSVCLLACLVRLIWLLLLLIFEIVKWLLVILLILGCAALVL